MRRKKNKLMAQKTHVIGFRLGSNVISTFSKTRWFTNYSHYSQILQNDYKIRKLCKLQLRAIFTKVGLINIEIQRSESLITIRLHVARTRLLREYGIVQVTLNLVTQLVRILRKVITSCMKLEIVRHPNATHKSILVAGAIAKRIEKRLTLIKVNNKVIKALHVNDVNNYKISLSGRLNGEEKARQLTLRRGRLPLQTINADINYASNRAKITHGVIGIKVWIFRP